MSTRTYARNEARYDRKLVDMMVADGMATYFPGLPGYVVKTDEGTYAIREHQIITATEMPIILQGVLPTDEYNAKRAKVEAFVEEIMTLRHGIAENRDGEFDEEAKDMVEKILDCHHDGEYEHALSEELWDAKYHAERNARLTARTAAIVAFPQGTYDGGCDEVV